MVWSQYLLRKYLLDNAARESSYPKKLDCFSESTQEFVEHNPIRPFAEKPINIYQGTFRHTVTGNLP